MKSPRRRNNSESRMLRYSTRRGSPTVTRSAVMKPLQTLFIVGLAAWTAVLLRAPLDAAMNSFVHLINLVFHESGHIIFSPFGEFMTVLGGSLMQILIPLVCA